jgi:thiol-disulfide isomerase/thioredoxin
VCVLPTTTTTKKREREREKKMLVTVADDKGYQAWAEEHRDDKAVLYFTASWCGPCKRISPVFDELAGRPEHAGVSFLKLDVDECQETGEQFDISSMPTFVALGPGSPFSAVPRDPPPSSDPPLRPSELERKKEEDAALAALWRVTGADGEALADLVARVAAAAS